MKRIYTSLYYSADEARTIKLILTISRELDSEGKLPYEEYESIMNKISLFCDSAPTEDTYGTVSLTVTECFYLCRVIHMARKVIDETLEKYNKPISEAVLQLNRQAKEMYNTLIRLSDE